MMKSCRQESPVHKITQSTAVLRSSSSALTIVCITKFPLFRFFFRADQNRSRCSPLHYRCRLRLLVLLIFLLLLFLHGFLFLYRLFFFPCTTLSPSYKKWQIESHTLLLPRDNLVQAFFFFNQRCVCLWSFFFFSFLVFF